LTLPSIHDTLYVSWIKSLLAAIGAMCSPFDFVWRQASRNR